MTPLEHNKYVGIANLAYGVVHLVLMVVMAVVVFGMLGLMAPNSGKGDVPPMAFFGVIMAFAVGINVIMSIPSFVAGYAFLKRKPWAKIAGIVAAVASAMHIPFGTAVCVYTFWFLFSEPGKALYEKTSRTLPPPPPDWVKNDQQEREREFVPGTSPPDWR